MLPRNARFWIWHNSTWVKLTLREGDEVALSSGGPTDEGYSYTMTQYSYDGEEVCWETDAIASDCDGRLDSYNVSYCSVMNLRDVESYDTDEVYLLPRWERESACQRDYAAEAMGY